MSQGLSIANNLLANQVQLNLNNNQKQLQNTVNQLSSGLRINSAADDPSGLAISTNLQTQVDGFNQASQNVQNANNAAQVALGALSTTTNILQRIRSLAVEAASDINSQNDRSNLQTEVSQLLLEVNRISQNTNFNGQALLDGTHAGFQAQANAFVTVTANTALAGGSSAAATVQNGDFNNPPQAPNSASVVGSVANWTLSGGFVLINGNDGVDTPVPAGYQALGGFSAGASATTTLTGLTAGATYSIGYLASAGNASSYVQVNVNGVNVTANPTGSPGVYSAYTSNTFVATGTTATLSLSNIQAGANTQFTGVTLNLVSSAGGSPPNAGFLIATASAANANFNTTIGTVAYNATGTYATVDGSIELQVVNTGASIAVQETFINSATGAISVDGTLFAPNQTSSDFDNVAITIGNFSAQDVGTTAFLKVSQNVAALTNPSDPAFNFQSGANEGDVIQVGIQATNTQTLRISNINVAISSSNNPSLGAEDAIGQIDNALQTLLAQQAQLGAVVVRLNEDQDSANTAATNLQASESNIRDLSVGAATTQFTRLQILVQVGTSVLTQSNANAQSILSLFR